MNTTNSLGSPETPLLYWRRVLRPLWWWLLLVLVLFGIHTHQRLMEKTRLNFNITLAGQPAFPEATATFDGQPIASGQNISLGNHQFMVTHPKGVAFKTNLFVWYGGRDFGKIDLPRATGTLSVSVNPPAPRIYVQGPEFNVTLTNSDGITTTVPTDQYVVSVQYRHWQGRQQVNVSENNRSFLPFTPSLGALHLSCNQSDATYQLLGLNDEILESGDFPATLVELPANTYRLAAFHHNHRWYELARVNNGITNPIAVEFKYGTAVLETQPAGASVTSSDGHYWGVTPLQLTELQPGIWYFTLQLNNYEPVTSALEITAYQTNTVSTNLTSKSYTGAMRSARQAMSSANYDRAVESLNDALRSQPNDLEAGSLLREANGQWSIQRAEALGKKGDYIAGGLELKTALTYLPGNEKATQLTADFKQHEPEQREQMRIERLNRPKTVLNADLARTLDADLFDNHEFKSPKSYREIESAIVNAFQAQPGFRLTRHNSPQPETFLLEVVQDISGVLLSGGQRVCVIVGGQTKDNETQILFKVLEYKTKHNVSMPGLLAFRDDQSTVAINAARMEMTDKLQNRLIEGVANVTAIIELAIGQTPPPTTPPPATP